MSIKCVDIINDDMVCSIRKEQSDGMDEDSLQLLILAAKLLCT